MKLLLKTRGALRVFHRYIALFAFQVDRTTQVVILSEAKNLRYLFSGSDADDSQRCFASLTMTLVVVKRIYGRAKSSSEENAL